jgi:gliding motility-associated-like protein
MHPILFILPLLVTISSFADTAEVKLKTTASCPTILNLPDTIYTCEQTLTLNPNVSVPAGCIPIDTLWTPSNGLSDPKVISPTVSLGFSPQYKLTILALTGNNVVVNGSFSGGNTGFASGYVTGSGGPWGPCSYAGTYGVSNNPSNLHSLWSSFGDHTTGGGQMMLVNGASTAGVNVWCQTVSVIPNTNYDFSTWLANVSTTSPAALQFAINGFPLGTVFNAPNTPAQWIQFHYIWNSGTNTSANICIINQNMVAIGNDFALDDIEFKEMCIVSDSVYIKQSAAKAFFTAPDTVCVGKPVFFQGSNSDPGLSHFWNFGDGSTSSSFSGNHVFSQSGAYRIVYAINSGGCKDTFRRYIFVREPYNTSSELTICGDSSIEFGNQVISEPGTYEHTFKTASGCDSAVRLTLKTGISPAVDFQFSAALNKPVQFTNTSINAVSFLWDFGDSAKSQEVNPVHQFKRTDEFKVCLTGWSADSCKHTVCKRVTAEVITAADVPSAFSPNGDNVNDILYVRGGGIEFLSFKLYNRWGQKIFESNDLLDGWDGTYQGQPVDLESVAYILSATFVDGSSIQKQGNITIVR